jgi:hypothetical protein
MAIGRIVGLVVLAVGIALLVIGHNASDSPVDQLSKTFLGHYTHETVWYLVCGAAAIVGGGALALFGARR